MRPSSPSNDSINKKCGEITITMKKNAKNVYSFNCWFCDTIYIQMKKFTMHMEKEHESQLEQATTNQKEEVKPGIEPHVPVGSFIPEIKVEDCLDIKSEYEEEHVTWNCKKENSPLFEDPLETTENAIDEISLTLPIKQEMDATFSDILDERNETSLYSETEDAKGDIEMTMDATFSDILDERNETSLHSETEDQKEDIEITIYSDDNDNADYRSDFSADEVISSSSDYKPGDSENDGQRITKRVKHKNFKSKEKELITALIDAYKNIPQLWDVTHPERCSIKQKEELFQNMTDNLNVQLKQSLKVNMVKKKINYLCKKYEKEAERRMADDEKNNTENSDLWYYENMEFLKSSTENKLKFKRKRPVKPLNDNLLDGLIDIYKNYNTLWDVNHLAFTVKDKRHETMQTMLEEIKTKMNLKLDIYKLEKHLAHIHKSFANDKQKKLECEKKQQDFQPSCSYYNKCDFLDLHQGPFCCSTCNEIIETYNDFQIHRSTHDGTAPFKCQECGMGFKKISNFTIHAKRHLGVFNFHCKICGKGYPFNAELALHMRSHTGAQPYVCSVCGEGFRTAISYDNHIRRHEERFKYFCHICNKGFNHMTLMNDHVKAHLNVRDVICTVCGKGFTSRKYLNNHRRIHEGKNYVCNICGKAFAQDAGLRKHKKYHDTPIGISSIQKEQN